MDKIFIFLIIMAILAISLIVCNIYAKRFNIDLKKTEPKNIPLQLWIVALVSSLLLCILGTFFVIKILRLEYCITNGLIIGLSTSIIGLIFNLLAFLPHKNGLKILFRYFQHPFYWGTYSGIVIVCALVGHLGRYLS